MSFAKSLPGLASKPSLTYHFIVKSYLSFDVLKLVVDYDA